MDKIRVTKKALKEFIKEKIRNDRRWTLRTLVVIYQGQSEDEKLGGCASHQNNIGFNKFDAERLTPIAERYIKSNMISPRGFALARNVLPKYWNQILNMSNKEKLEKQFIEYASKQK